VAQNNGTCTPLFHLRLQACNSSYLTTIKGPIDRRLAFGGGKEVYWCWLLNGAGLADNQNQSTIGPGDWATRIVTRPTPRWRMIFALGIYLTTWDFLIDEGKKPYSYLVRVLEIQQGNLVIERCGQNI